MHGLDGFLKDFALVLCAAALMGALFQRLRQPAILGYLFAGVFIGPHVPFPLVADLDTVHTLAELGVILLMFSLGLEFSVRKLMRLGGRAGFVTAIDVGLMVWLGMTFARLYGWSVRDAIFTGAIIAISSTMIAVRSFDQVRVQKRTRDLITGILVFQDLFAIVMVALLSASAAGLELTSGSVALGALEVVGVLLVLAAVGLLVIPRLVRFAVGSGNRETIIVTAVGISFAFALAAKAFGSSVALGAFLAGTLASDSGQGRLLERTVRPLRDLFGAIFFVAVGMLIDPVALAHHWQPILALTGLVLVGKTVGISLASLLTGNGVHASIRAGMTLAQIGEFSFLIAGISVVAGGDGFLVPVAVGVCVLTTLTTPWMVRYSDAVGRRAERALPQWVERFLTRYRRWIEGWRGKIAATDSWSRLRHVFAFLIVDAAILSGLVIGVSLSMPALMAALEEWTGLSARWADDVIVALGAIGALPFVVGILRGARQVGVQFAQAVVPVAAAGPKAVGESTPGAAPPIQLVRALQVAALATVGLPVLALTLPFLPSLPGLAIGAFVLLAPAVLLWRRGGELDRSRRSGAEMLMAAIAHPERGAERTALERARELLPGLRELGTIVIDADHAAVEHTLRELDLRGRSGATVVGIHREPEGIVLPGATEAIRAGDVLVMSGGREAIERARLVLMRAVDSGGSGEPEGECAPSAAA